MGQSGFPNTPEGWRKLSVVCRTAIGSVHCQLQSREKRVIEQIICFSYDWDRDFAMFGSGQMLSDLAMMDPGDTSNALGALTRTGIVKKARGAPLYGLRKPMVYSLVPDALVALAVPPKLTAEANHRRNLIAAWHVAANSAYPQQCDLIPPDPDLFGDAFLEISRASVLASAAQNESPKPGLAGEVVHSEGNARPGPAAISHRPEVILPPGKTLRDMLAESLAQADQPSVVIGDSPITNGQSDDPNWRNSNYLARASDPDIPDGYYKYPSGKHPDSGSGVIGNSPITATATQPKVIFVPVRDDEAWQPPTDAEHLFTELLEQMGRKVMANYGSEWFKQCRLKPRCVYEVIEEYRNGRNSPRAKPWSGGHWQQAFQRAEARQARRLAAKKEIVP